jgi:hypothetical protein
MPPNEKIKPEDLAFNNAAVEAIQKNAAERDALRKKNKDVADAARARRRANRESGGGGTLRGLSVLNGPFAGTSGTANDK